MPEEVAHVARAAPAISQQDRQELARFADFLKLRARAKTGSDGRSRAAILTGAKAAHTLHRDLGIREQVERSGGGRVDVFGAIAKLGATLMFQPLDKLLGAYLPGDEVGVLITTKRPLPVQRFMRFDLSDDEWLFWSP